MLGLVDLVKLDDVLVVQKTHDVDLVEKPLLEFSAVMRKNKELEDLSVVLRGETFLTEGFYCVFLPRLSLDSVINLKEGKVNFINKIFQRRNKNFKEFRFFIDFGSKKRSLPLQKSLSQ